MVRAAIPESLRLERGLTLLEVLIYTVVLSFLLLAVYQTNSFVQQQSIQSSQISDLNFELDASLQRLRQTVQRSLVPVRIISPLGGSTPVGAGPVRYEDRNCLLLELRGNENSPVGNPPAPTPDREITIVGLVWVEASGAAQLMQAQGNDCSALSGASAESISKPIFLPDDAADWFSQQVASAAPGGSTEVDFRFRARVGTSSMSTTTEPRRARLSTSTITKPECRVAAPDRNWFTDYGNERIQSASVTIKSNYESNSESLALVSLVDGALALGVRQEWFPSLGLLHIYSKDGLKVSDWLRVLSDVKYVRGGSAAPLSESSLRSLEFVLGEASVSSAGQSFYLGVKLSSALNRENSATLATKTCYPGFVSEGPLGLNRVAGGAACSASGRLEGSLVLLADSQEVSFLTNRVLKLVYTQQEPVEQAFVESNREPSSGGFWLGNPPLSGPPPTGSSFAIGSSNTPEGSSRNVSLTNTHVVIEFVAPNPAAATSPRLRQEISISPFELLKRCQQTPAN